MTGFATKFSRVERLAQRLVTALETEIARLPDNPQITRLSANAFTMPASALVGSWSPHYHDYRWQYRELIAILRKTTAAQVLTRIRTVLTQGFYHNGKHQPAHPAVKAFVLQLLDGD